MNAGYYEERGKRLAAEQALKSYQQLAPAGSTENSLSVSQLAAVASVSVSVGIVVGVIITLLSVPL